MKIFSFLYSDTREDKKDKPQQDKVVIKDNIFVVADGVTILHETPYPNTSIHAVEEATTSIVNTLQQQQNGLNSIYKAFEVASAKVAAIPNIKQHYAGLTIAYGFISNNILYFAQLNDAGVMVFDKHGNMEIDFIANQTDFVNHMKETTFVADSIEEHKYVREQIVNRQFNFGVLNGDMRAKSFLHVGATNLSLGQGVFLYTDGFIPYVYNKDFVSEVFKAKTQKEIANRIADKELEAEKYKKERALIVIKI